TCSSSCKCARRPRAPSSRRSSPSWRRRTTTCALGSPCRRSAVGGALLASRLVQLDERSGLVAGGALGTQIDEHADAEIGGALALVAVLLQTWVGTRERGRRRAQRGAAGQRVAQRRVERAAVAGIVAEHRCAALLLELRALLGQAHRRLGIE